MLPRLAVLAGLVLSSAASGQDALFLAPEAFSPAPGAAPRFHLERGRALSTRPAPWDDAAVRWLFIRGEGTQENRDRAPEAPDAAGTVALPAPPAGSAVIGLDLRPATREIDATDLRAFAKSRCDEELPADVTGKVRLARVESCKALVRIGDRPGGSSAAVSETAQSAEIVTHMDPTTAGVGSDVAIISAIGGDDVEDARVLVTSLATGKTEEVRTGDGGNGHFHISAPGRYRAEFHHLARAKPGSGADWTLVSATLVFEVRGAGK